MFTVSIVFGIICGLVIIMFGIRQYVADRLLKQKGIIKKAVIKNYFYSDQYGFISGFPTLDKISCNAVVSYETDDMTMTAPTKVTYAFRDSHPIYSACEIVVHPVCPNIFIIRESSDFIVKNRSLIVMFIGILFTAMSVFIYFCFV